MGRLGGGVGGPGMTITCVFHRVRIPQGMRLAPNDTAPERGLLEKSELMEEPMLGMACFSGFQRGVFFFERMVL